MNSLGSCPPETHLSNWRNTSYILSAGAKGGMGMGKMLPKIRSATSNYTGDRWGVLVLLAQQVIHGLSPLQSRCSCPAPLAGQLRWMCCLCRDQSLTALSCACPADRCTELGWTALSHTHNCRLLANINPSTPTFYQPWDKAGGRNPSLSPASPSEDPKPKCIHTSQRWGGTTDEDWGHTGTPLLQRTGWGSAKLITEKSHLLITNDPDPQSAYYPSFINYFYSLLWQEAEQTAATWLFLIKHCFGENKTPLPKTKHQTTKQSRFTVSKYRKVDKQINQNRGHSADMQTDKAIISFVQTFPQMRCN